MSNDRTAWPWTMPERLHHTNWLTNTAADFLEVYRDPAGPFFYAMPGPPCQGNRIMTSGQEMRRFL